MDRDGSASNDVVNQLDLVVDCARGIMTYPRRPAFASLGGIGVVVRPTCKTTHLSGLSDRRSEQLTDIAFPRIVRTPICWRRPQTEPLLMVMPT